MRKKIEFAPAQSAVESDWKSFRFSYQQFWLRMMTTKNPTKLTTATMKAMKIEHVQWHERKKTNWLKVSPNWCIFAYLITTLNAFSGYKWWLTIGRNNSHENVKQFFSFIGFWVLYYRVQVATDDRKSSIAQYLNSSSALRRVPNTLVPFIYGNIFRCVLPSQC